MENELAVVDLLYLEGLEMKRAQFRRSNPELSDADVERQLEAWILDRPMDAPGRVIFR